MIFNRLITTFNLGKSFNLSISNMKIIQNRKHRPFYLNAL